MKTNADFNENYILVTDSQDVEYIARGEGIIDPDITAAMVMVGDGEYLDVWFSESAAPWNLNSTWHKTDYYRGLSHPGKEHYARLAGE